MDIKQIKLQIDDYISEQRKTERSAAYAVLSVLKEDAKNYRHVEANLSMLSRQLLFYGEEYKDFIKAIYGLLEEEKGDLPLTNRQ